VAQTGYVFQNQLFPTKTGTPQGGIINPVLANMMLDGLEHALAMEFPRAKQKGRKMNLVRYADDFIIIGHSKEWLEHEIMPFSTEFLSKRGLRLSQEKSRITNITERFDFLGLKMRIYGGESKV